MAVAPIKPKIPIILASGSSIRKSMLESTGIEFSITPADVDEDAVKESLKNKSMEEVAETLSCAKAEAVSKENLEAIVIGSDQICTVDSEILSKPGNFDNAFNNLKKLSGKTHKQQCGVCFYHNGEKKWSLVDVAELTMKELSDEEIKNYLTADEPFQSCGAYKFESLGINLFREIKGSHHTIQGLPLLPLLQALQEYKAYSLDKNQ